MPIKRYKPEQIVTMLRQIEVGIANGKTTPQACKEAEITMQTFYRWRKEYGGLKMDQAKRMKELITATHSGCRDLPDASHPRADGGSRLPESSQSCMPEAAKRWTIRASTRPRDRCR